MSDLITLDQLKKVIPKNIRVKATDSLVDRINNSVKDPVLREQYRENVMGYIHVLQEGKFKIDSYLDAVKYVSYKLMGNTNIEAFIKTFPERYQYFVDKGTDPKDIASYVTSYNKNKLVTLIMEQSITPAWVMNQDVYQKAINTQAELMTTARSEKVRSDAANSLLTHLKPPETKKIELDIGMKQDKSIEDIREATRELVKQQRDAIQSGRHSAKDIAHSQIIEGESDIKDVN